MLCHISLKYVQKPSQRNKPAKVQAYNGKIKCFIRKRALILLFTYIYRHWKANLTEVMIVEFNQGQRGLAGSRIFLHLPISTLWWKLCSQLCLWLWKSGFMSHNFKPPPHLVYKMKMQIFSLVVWLASFSCCSAVSDSVIPWTGGPPGSSVLGSLQARILEWVVIPFSRASAWPRDWTWVSCIAGRFFAMSATREIPGCVV